MEDVVLFEFSPEYYEELMRLWEDTGMGGAERGDDIDTILRSLDMGGRLLLMKLDTSGDLIGSAWMTFDGRRIHLHHFAINPYYQGKGYSKVLLESCLKHVKEHGHQVKLEVHSSNVKAVNLYTKAGFKYLGDYDIFIIRNPETL